MHNSILMYPHIALAKVKHDESLCPQGETWNSEAKEETFLL